MREKGKTLDKKCKNLAFKKIAYKQRLQEQGITLIALVVTIVILLILSGVTLNIALSDGGLFSKTKEAAKKYQTESEREALEMSIMSYKLGENADDESTKLGKKLVDRNLDNSSTWDIIVEKSTNKTYGTGWYYIEKGQEIEGLGTTENAFVINYETGEIIGLEEDNYNNFNYKSTIAVTDGIVFNLDSANVGLNKESWGKNTTLYYYDADTYSTEDLREAAFEKQKDKTVEDNDPGYDRQKSDEIEDYLDKDTGAFKFNGNNYIEIKSNAGYDFSNGFTFEFYGKILNNSPSIRENDGFIGLIGFWNGEFDQQCSVRLGYEKNAQSVYYSLVSESLSGGNYGSWNNPSSPWNQLCYVGNILNRDFYVALTISPSEDETVSQDIFIGVDDVDGAQFKKYSGWLSKEYYDSFLNKVENLNYLEFGRCSMTVAGNWDYTKGLCYSARIYNKALSEENAKANYEVTRDFHKYIIDSKNK